MKQNRHKALVVSSFIKFYKAIKPFAEKAGFADTLFASDSSDAKKIIMTDSDIAAVIVNTPLKDGFGLDFALETAVEKYLGVMVFVNKELYKQVSEKTTPRGILAIMKPTSQDLLIQSLGMLKASSERLIKYEKQNIELQNKMEEIKLHTRAKMLLIQNLGMTEEQAHKYIEQRAMDARISKAAVSRNIIKAYGN